MDKPLNEQPLAPGKEDEAVDVGGLLEGIQDEGTREALKTAFGTIAAQKAHWRTKAKEKPPVVEEPPKPTIPPVTATPSSQTVLDAREYSRLLHQGYSEKQIDVVERFAKAEGRKASELLNDPVVKAALEGVKTQERAEAASPSGSGRTPNIPQKGFNELPSAERKTKYGDTVSNLIKKGREGR